MTRLIPASLTFALVMTSAASYAEGVDWKILKSDACGGFTVMMPGSAKEESASEKEIILRSYAVERSESLFTVACVVYPPGATVDVQNELATNRDNFNRESEASLVSEAAISLQGVSGLDFTSDSIKHRTHYRVRVYVDGNRVYMLTAAVRKGQDELLSIEQFLGSLHLADH
jgi:hypothetical protein